MEDSCMRVLKNESLKKFTTIQIGGIAKTMYVPENTYELIELLQKNKQIFALGGVKSSH